jgi:hypothetical protein
MTRTLSGSLLKSLYALILCFIFSSSNQAGDFPPKKYAVQLTATIQESPPKITFNWPGDPDTQGYQVSRRTLDGGWQQLGSLNGGASSFEDSNIQVGQVYEYQVIKQWADVYHGYGYIRAGIKAPLMDLHGKVILIVENSVASSLGGELAQLRRDLVNEGWQVIQHNVSSGDSPNSVRQLIQSDYNADSSSVKAVLLLGHVAVPYSGNIVPDGHPNHQGAWPADVYYGDVNGNWTDSSVNTVIAERESHWNTPGDGKFDQNEPPSTVELQVGRVDLSNMTCFSNKARPRYEMDLMRQYLQKNHAFRTAQKTFNRRGIICDNFSDKGKDPIAGSAWRSFSTFFGQNALDEEGWDQYLPAATSGSYLWSFASGGGSYYYCTGVASSDDLALNNIHTVFTMWMGSYFGDWNNESNFLRAALGSGDVLTSTYSGFPSTWYFPMGLGESVGYSVLQSQNNNTNGLYAPWDQGSHQVHIALHGDPTLRMFPVKPAQNLSASAQPGQMNLSWSPSDDSGIVGYHVYRASSEDGPFTRVTASPVAGNNYTDSPVPGSYVYMVRAIKLEQTGSGSFYNPSIGITASGTVTGEVPKVPATPSLTGSAVSAGEVHLNWPDQSDAKGYKLERKTSGDWQEIRSFGANESSYSDTGLNGATDYYYRLRAYNDAGNSDYSPEIKVTTPPTAQDPLQLAITVNSGSIKCEISGSPGQNFVLEQSSDLKSWSQLSSGTTSDSAQTINVPTSTGQLFLRTRSQ